LELIGAEDAEAHRKDAALKRIEEWLGAEMLRVLPTHAKLKTGETGQALEGMARGLAFQLLESGAAVDLRNDATSGQITPEQREAMKAAGLRTGRVAAHIPDAQKPAAQRMVAILQASQTGETRRVAPEGAGSFPLDGEWAESELNSQGYLRFGKRAVRADLAERLGWEISKRRREAGTPAFELPAELASVVSCPGEEFPAIVKGFGLAPAEKDEETGAVTKWRFLSRHRTDSGPPRGRKPAGGKPGNRPPKGKGGKSQARQQSRPGGRGPREKQADPDSPFAALASLLPPPPAPKPKKKKKKKPAAKPEAASAEAPNQSAESEAKTEAPETKTEPPKEAPEPKS
ncbi:MAG: helicase, partial [Henriciella sp.]